jgi:hypothetical protein
MKGGWDVKVDQVVQPLYFYLLVFSSTSISENKNKKNEILYRLLSFSKSI